MAGLLVEACSPSLRSSYSHLSHQLDWHQQRSRFPVAPISPSHSTVEDIRTALESHAQASVSTSSGHDPGFPFRANQQFLLSRESSSLISTLKDLQTDSQVDDVDMGGNAQRPKKQEGVRKQNVSKQETRAEMASAHSETNIVSPTSSTPAKNMETPQLTLTGATAQKDEEFLEEEDAEFSGTPSDDGGDAPVQESTAMTAAERLAEKRRMKRFRLTHSQTRFLNSEFSRQPHPDAAQRERLSNEIPGLSPRQVQVWFQNRRAKMKRLSGDDQERMMRSRALPTGFNLSSTLRPTGSEQAQAASGASQLIAPSSSMRAPIGGGERQTVTPINMSLVYGNPSYSLNSAGGSSNVSPSTSLQSANASPMFAGSPNASPFVQAGGEAFPRTYNPANLGFPAQGNFRGRSGSLMSLPASSPSVGGSPLVHPRASVSNENIQNAYQTQYDESNRGSHRMYLSEMSNLSMQSPSLSDSPHGHPPVSTENTQTMYPTQYGESSREAVFRAAYLSDPSNMNMTSQSHLSSTDYQTPPGLRRDSSVTRSSTMPVSSADQSFTSPTWLATSSHHQLPSPNYQFQPPQMRRRQTQPSYPTPQHQSTGMATVVPSALSQPSSDPSLYQPASDHSSAIAQMAAYAASLPFPPELELEVTTSPPFQAPPASPTSAQVSPIETFEPQQQQQQQEHEEEQWAGMYIPPSP